MGELRDFVANLWQTSADAFDLAMNIYDIYTQVGCVLHKMTGIAQLPGSVLINSNISMSNQ